MNDRPKYNICNYTAKYAGLFPASTIVVVRLTGHQLWLSVIKQRSALAPLYQILQQAGVNWDRPLESGGLLLHAFSNGGCWTFADWAEVLQGERPKLSDGHYLPPTAIIFDSCPGTDGIRVTLRALLNDVRNHFARAFIRSIFSVAYILRWVLFVVFLRRRKPIPGTISQARAILAHEKVLPWTTLHTPRRFLYPRIDEICPPEAVESYASELRALGMTNVKLGKFDDGTHVAVMESDPDRYWSIIKEAWNEALALSEASQRHSLPVRSKL
ncbi:hypothetical protein BKA62DRAFT_766705 [Auriculariales sp. MPI-PUGE-AT-0066]|nr:hypothetical protein BKA62DRAFT_766705 [Auriculariales sp. MPI-PUGE-AT-0066]